MTVQRVVVALLAFVAILSLTRALAPPNVTEDDADTQLGAAIVGSACAAILFAILYG